MAGRRDPGFPGVGISPLTRCFLLGAAVAVVLPVTVRDASAQGLFGLGPWAGEAEFRFEREHTATRVPGGPKSDSERTRYDERLSIRNGEVFVFDPRLVTGSVAGTFALFQEDARVDHRDLSRDGTLLDYAVRGVFLSKEPYTATLFANRTESVLSREFGGRSEITFENRGATLRLREDSILRDVGFPYFSSTLGARQELTKEETTVLGQAFRRDEVRGVLSYEGHKGFETADLDLRYEFTDLEDRENPLGDFRTHAANLSYSLDFGPSLNRRWDSRLLYFARTGAIPNSFFSADEQLRVDHSADLYTDYRYLFSWSEVGVERQTTRTHTGIALLQHELYRSLTSRLQVDGTVQDFSRGERLRSGGQADFAYRRAIPRQGQVSGSAGARYQVEDNQFAVTRVDVVDEPHSAAVPLGGGVGFTLANPFVIADTIQVVVTRGGARLPTIRDVDYAVVQEGDLTRIVPLPGSAVVLAGDPLAVSYSFEVDPSLTLSTVSWHGTARLDFPWIAVSLAHEQSEQSLLGGRNGRFLDDRRTDTARLELRADWEWLGALVTAQYQVQEATRLEFAAWQFTQFVSLGSRPDLRLTLEGQESFTDFLPRRQSQVYSARGTLEWSPLPRLSVTGLLGWRVVRDSELPTESLHEVGLRGRWGLGKLDVVPTFSWIDRARGSTDTTDLRFEVRLIRRF